MANLYKLQVTYSLFFQFELAALELAGINISRFEMN